MRQLARRAGLYSSASLVAIIGVAGLTLAAVFAGTWHALDDEVSALRTGGDVRVTYAEGDLVLGEDPRTLVDPFADVDDVEASMPVARGEARIGSDPAQLVALSAGALGDVLPGTGPRLDETALAESAASGAAAAPAPPAGADAAMPRCASMRPAARRAR